MKLNQSGKSELREVIEKELKDYEGDKRVKIDKNILEDLIFEKDIAIFPDGRQIEVKYIVWSGPFLSKIDLSEVSFDNVEWNSSVGYAKEYKTKYGKEKYQSCNINLSNTNIQIDFKKSFYALAYPDKKIKVSSCNFTNVDLSKSNGNIISYIVSCDLENTNIELNIDINESMDIYFSNLKGINLSNITLSMLVFYESNNSKIHIINTNLCDTGVHIEYRDYLKIPSGILSKYIKRARKLVPQYESEIRGYEDICAQGYMLFELLRKGKLDGCYVNDVYILNEKEREKLKSTMSAKYKDMKGELIRSTKESLSRQIRELKK